MKTEGMGIRIDGCCRIVWCDGDRGDGCGWHGVFRETRAGSVSGQSATTAAISGVIQPLTHFSTLHLHRKTSTTRINPTQCRPWRAMSTVSYNGE